MLMKVCRDTNAVWNLPDHGQHRVAHAHINTTGMTVELVRPPLRSVRSCTKGREAIIGASTAQLVGKGEVSQTLSTGWDGAQRLARHASIAIATRMAAITWLAYPCRGNCGSIV